jgi:hypothetical protein
MSMAERRVVALRAAPSRSRRSSSSRPTRGGRMTGNSAAYAARRSGSHPRPRRTRSTSATVSWPGSIPISRMPSWNRSNSSSAPARSPRSARERSADRSATSDPGSTNTARSAASQASCTRPRRARLSAVFTSTSIDRRRHSSRSEVSQFSNSDASGTANPSRNSPATSSAAPSHSSPAASCSSRSTSSSTRSGASRTWPAAGSTAGSPACRRMTRSASLSEWRAAVSVRSPHSRPMRCSRLRVRRGDRAR